MVNQYKIGQTENRGPNVKALQSCKRLAIKKKETENYNTLYRAHFNTHNPKQILEHPDFRDFADHTFPSDRGRSLRIREAPNDLDDSRVDLQWSVPFS